MLWDVFCRVIDNHGDLGVCWRLSRDLAQRGEQVRLWVDEPSALAWLAPAPEPGIQVLPWREPFVAVEPGEVVIESFGCELPLSFIARMQHAYAPIWLNLEYLSAEPYVERCHGLKSPVLHGAGQGLDKWFYYPGFTERTGGLLREPGLLECQQAFNRDSWLAQHAVARLATERVVSLFCYADFATKALLDALQHTPTLLLVTPGWASAQVGAVLGQNLLPGSLWQQNSLRIYALPYLAQAEFDALLWSSDVNWVRGEDSFVRAQWAGKPFIWHIYPQEDGAHRPKLEAFLARYLSVLPVRRSTGDSIRQVWQAGNGWLAPEAIFAALFQGTGMAELQQEWQALAQQWQRSLRQQADLTTSLMSFVEHKRLARA